MNGPTAEGDKVWEKSWSVDEIRKGAVNWSLAGDAGLLLHLQEFSQKMVSRTHEIEKQVDGLVHETKVANVRVHNVFNDFIMLANTQFVENRVYDEDVSQEPKDETKKEEQEKSREQREVELIPKIAEAIGFGLKVIENSFEELDVNVADSDSEEDDDDMVGRADKILKVKDPYAHRPLPHLIGSPAFMQEDDVGIAEEFSDEEEIEEVSDNGSISDSDKSDISDSESESSYSDTESETDSDAEKPQKRTKSKISKQSKNSDDESSEGGDLFGTKDSDEASDMDSEEEQVLKQKPIGGMGGIAAELAAKIGAPPARPADDGGDSEGWDEEPKPKQKEHKHKKKRADSSTSKGSHHRKRADSERSKGKSTKKAVKEEDPFGGPSIEEDSPFSNKGGLFSGGGGLFDDDNDGGLFGDVPKPKAAKPAPPVEEDEEEEEEEEIIEKPVERAKTKSGKNIPTGGISIFGGGDDELFTPSPLEDQAPKQKTSAPAKSFGGGLFDDGDDDLFGSAPKKAPTKKESTKPPSKPSVDLFGGEDDDEGDLFASMPPVKKAEPPKAAEKKVTKKKLPAGAVSAFGSGPNPLAALIKSQRQGSDEEEEGGWSDSNKSTSSSLSSAKHDAKTERSPSVSSNSLFAEEPEEQKTEKKPSKPSSKVSSGLFDDEEDDLFSGLPKTKPAAKAASKPNKPSLFVEDGEGDLFGSASPPAPAAAPAKKKPTGGVSLFGGADLFGDSLKKTPEPEEKKIAPLTEPAPSPAKPKTTVKNSPLSLFDDDDEGDGGDLFGAAPPQKIKPPDDKRKRTRSKSLFEDEDVLFGTSPAAPEDNPTVDLFGANSPLTPSESKAKPFPKEEPKASPSVKVTGSTTKSSSTDLFGGDDTTDDLFAAPAKKPEPIKKPTVLPLGGATEDESSSDMFVAPAKPAAPVVKSKKPVGGVSMFGGMDPFAAKKAASSPKEEKPEVVLKMPVADPLFDDADDTFGKPAPKVERTPEPVSNVDTQRSSVSPSKIKAAGLNINPQALLPGAAPPIKEPEQVAIGFDQPASANTLQSLTKGRAKIQQKRRLPSRGRGGPQGASNGQQNGPIDEIDALTTVLEAPPVVNSIVTQPKLPDITSQPPEVTATPPAGRGRDLFGNDDLFPETSQSDPLFSFGADSSSTKKDSTDNDMFKSVEISKGNGPPLGDEDDIFGSGKKSVPQKQDSGDIISAKSSGLADGDDIFASGPKKSKVPSDLDIFAPKSSQKSETNDIFRSAEEKNGEKPAPDLFKSPATDEEDIFASKSTKVTKSKSSVMDDNDDIFADSSVNKKKEPKPVVTESQPSATAMDDDEVDIFAPKTKQSTTTKKADAFEDDDDLFAKPVKKVTKLKKEKTKDEDLFKDETDIFASLPASAPKEKKKKKKTDAGSKSLFKGDVDDIFATPKSSSPTSKPKTKKTTTPKKKTTSAKDDASIFDENAPSIFDDPLNAMQS
ncbi:WASH complex subunit 2-like [Lineus longissimus]|uniref:WASH complex subunit 2-like n=1 Tax=Lineus longissimus TaxID=88925 RepID=UPI002B4DFEA2